jgi:hypothetical protein
VKPKFDSLKQTFSYTDEGLVERKTQISEIGNERRSIITYLTDMRE